MRELLFVGASLLAIWVEQIAQSAINIRRPGLTIHTGRLALSIAKPNGLGLDHWAS